MENELSESNKKMRRKVFYYVVSLMIGIALAHYALWYICVLFAIGGFLLCRIDSTWDQNQFNAAGLCCLCGMALLFLMDIHFEQGSLAKQWASSEEAYVKGEVVQIEPIDEKHFRLVVDVSGEHLLCNYYGDIKLWTSLIGSTVSFAAKIEKPKAAGNPRCFDYRLYLKSEKIGYTAVIRTYFREACTPSIWQRWKCFVLEQRESFISMVHLSDSAEGLIRGVLFGDLSRMDEETYTDFRQNGTAHVLAVSGLHVGMLYSVYRWIYGKVHTKFCTAMFIGLLFLYGTVTLWSVSVTRAILLIVLVLLGNKLQRRYDLLTALSAVALFLIIRNPYVIFGASFQMSFLAVTSIVFLQDTMENMVGKTLSASFAVQAGLTPYMAYVFNYVSFVGILCNIPIIFLISIIVPIGMGGFVFYFFFHRVIPCLTIMLNGIGNLTIWVNGLLSADGILSFDVISPPLWSIVLFYGVVFYGTSEQAMICFGRRQWKRGVAPLCCVVVLALAAIPAGNSDFDKASLVFVDVGQGDCLHIKDSAGRNMLIDGGGSINYNVGEKTLKPYLLKNGFDWVDLAAATHLHTDHYLGLQQLAECFDVRDELTAGKAGDVIKLGENEWLEILWPMTYDADAEDENLNSLIFLVHQNGVKTLITGDITAEGEAMLLEQYRGTDKLAADILKIAHHGSAYSTSDAFLEAVNPQVAVISVGQNNYGHPSEIVIEKLEKNGIMVFRTDLDGAVGIINRKGTISVCTEKQR